MAKSHPIDIASVRRQIAYDAKTGVFYWRISKRGPVKAGDEAGCIKKGRLFIKVDQQVVPAGRIAWVLHYDEDPGEHEIDHKNGKPLDFKIVNLRKATHKQNCENIRGEGVQFYPSRNRWLARITVNYRQINLGRYRTREEAAAVYEAAKKKHRGEFARAASAT
jgi:HNH endonuclease/AP2 domain